MQALKVVLVSAFLTAARGGLVPAAYQSYAPAATVVHAAPAIHSVPVAYGAPQLAVDEYDHNPQYSFSYAVNDQYTGDSKSQTETRSGDNVVGQYSLIDSDGTKRTVDYTADEHNGFNAVVTKEPIGHAAAVYAPAARIVAPAPAVAPLVAAHSPIVQSRIVSPLALPAVRGYGLADGYASVVPNVAHGYASVVPNVAHGYAAIPNVAHGYAAYPNVAQGYAIPNVAQGYAIPNVAHGYASVVPSVSHGYASLAAPAYIR
jgi:hypothetical protein